MKTELQFVFILASLFTFLYVILKIRKHKLNIDDSILWILWSIFLLFVSLFPELFKSISKWLGFESTSNFIICLFVFFSYMMLFLQTIRVSELKEKNKELVHNLSIERKKNSKK